MFKKFLSSIGLAAALIFTGCSYSVSGSAGDPGYGSLSIVKVSKALYDSDLAFVKVAVTGDGIEGEITSDFAKLENKAASNVVVEKIPVGKNRIVTAYAYDSAKSKIGTTMVRNIVDIAAGSNSCNVDKTTTALGCVFEKLFAKGYKIEEITSNQIGQIKNAIKEDKSWALINTEAIAEDFVKNDLQSAESYVLAPASAIFVNNLEGLTVQVGDPVSEIVDAGEGEGKVEKVAPGTWPVYLIQDNKVSQKTYATFVSGHVTDLGTFGSAVKDRIIVHIETSSGYKNIYAWTENPKVEIFGAWSGKPMEDSDGDGWYDVVIEKTACNLIFNGNGQTSDLSREAGEWWYKDGKWCDYNPVDSVVPELISFAADKTSNVTGKVTFTVAASDDKNLKSAVITQGNTTIKTVSLSGKMASETFEWDSNDLENGTYEFKCTVYDAADNVAETIGSVSITINNVNLPPFAVISGAGRANPGAEVTYSAAGSYDKHGTITAYQWTVSGGAVIKSGAASAECLIQFPNTEDAICTVTLKVKDAEGAWSETASQTVKIKTKVSNDFREETIYFLMTARWYDGDESNNRWCRADDNSGNRENNDHPWRGDFKGVIEKLDYIKAMGFTAIWITPPVLNRSDYDFHGYHAWNMNKIDPRLESDDVKYQDFIDACHEKGLKVIQDVVFNHSCRYGLEDLYHPKYWGDRDNEYWGKDNPINYYDEYNPNFTYNGLDYEPISGKCWYNGDLWQKEKPELPWNPDLSSWGVAKGWNSDNRQWYGCQWPTLELFDPQYFHTKWLGNWEGPDCQSGTIHEDCIDLNTESPAVQKYLIDAYSKYIEMGVDAFRVDTVKHINRVVFNRRLNPAFMKAAKDSGNDNFFMFGECCTKVNEVWNKNNPSLSAPFYTWKETQEWDADDTKAAEQCYEANHVGTENQLTSNNHYLNGNEYHKPDYTNKSDLNVIDFAMHMNFTDAGNAYGQRGNDKWYNDATWNVTYVESHDYSPDNGPKQDHDIRCTAGDDEWAEDMTLLWTFRGIPCLFQGSEIRFKAGVTIDAGPTMPLEETGRAYFGGNLEGTLTATDFSEYTNATGTIAQTMDYPLVKHLRDLNKIRRAIPALQKGQYSNDDCNGGMCFKRRYTDNEVDSFVLVTISGDARFTGLPAGTYVDVVTGDTKTISEGGTISTSGCSGQGNARIYVNTSLKGCDVTGKIAGYSPFLK